MSCTYCNKEDAFMTCSACRTGAYCNEVCQRKHWAIHKPLCKAAQAVAAAAEKKTALRSFVTDRIAGLDQRGEYKQFFEKIPALLVDHLSKESSKDVDSILDTVLADYWSADYWSVDYWSGLSGPIQILMTMDDYFTDTLYPAIKSIITDSKLKV